MKTALILVAAFFTGWAGVSWLAGFDADFRVSSVIAVICLAGVFFLDHRAAEERERMTRGRETVWDRRDLEAWDDELDQLRELD